MASRGHQVATPTREEELGNNGAGNQQELPVSPPPLVVDFGAIMQGLVQVMQTQANAHAALQAQVQAQARVPSKIVQRVVEGPSVLEHFRRLNPPYFKGESQPIIAKHWLRSIEKIFWTIRCEEDEKVNLATFMLEERADVWWSAMLQNLHEDGTIEATSGDFIQLFKSKYISEHVQDKMEQNFLSLT